MHTITLDQVQQELKDRSERFAAMDVFREQLEPEGDALEVRIRAAELQGWGFEWKGDHRVLRVWLPGRKPGNVGAIAGGFAGAALALGGQKSGARSEDAVAAAVVGGALGVLLGSLYDNSQADAFERHRILTVRFDEKHNRWRVYQGGLVPWMKEHLSVRS